METITLNGSWQFRQSGSDLIWLPATVPGCVHTDLLAGGAIPDPFDADNEKQVMWVGEADWQYQKIFTVPENFMDHTTLLLRCNGLDTLATILVNGSEIGRAENQFICYEFDVREALQPGENRVEVHFQSALKYGQARLAERYIHSWSTDDHKLPGGNYVRKSQCNFGWDWGPKLVTCGIWRDIELVGFDEARLEDVHIRQEHADGAVRLAVSARAEVLDTQPVEYRAVVRFAGQDVAQGRSDMANPGKPIYLDVLEPQLWWPNGLGGQPLYEVQVELVRNQEVVDSISKEIGLRTLKLVTEADEWGESFQFECNGVPFFAKGANWIPADTFVTRMERGDYERLLSDAKDVHMNMLRVWGGGIYEQDDFYELCDRMGIVIWQDFMYACATYPTFDDAFMENSEIEARQQVRRLRHHACLGLWCGNNELEQGLVDDTWTDIAMSWEDYGRLFDDRLKEICSELDPETSYWPGSPHSPHGDRRKFNDPRWGDAHIWSVWHGLEPFEFYRTCLHRFNSEFGFQSFPEMRTIRTFAKPQDYSFNSPIMEHHQRNHSGNAIIIHYMLDWFRLPAGFESQVVTSQVLQGMAIKYAVEHWRRTMPRGMGTLYWQLNDCWPVASWSSIDYFGRWKALHYMARHFFNPLLLSGLEDWDSGQVEIHATNDTRESVEAEIAWRLVQVNSGEEVAGGQLACRAEALANTHAETLELGGLLDAHGRRNLLLHLEMVVGGQVAAENLVLFCRPKALNLEAPGLDARRIDSDEGKVFEFEISAQKPALWAWLDSGADAVLSDNFFHLLPGRPRRIRVESTSNREKLESSLRLASLWDTFQP